MKHLRTTPILAAALSIAAAGCDASRAPVLSADELQDPRLAAGVASRHAPRLVEVTASGHVQLELSTSEIPAGWTTFRLRNDSHAVHFAVLEKFPGGRGLAEYRSEIAPVFQNLMDLMNGRPATFPEAGTELPAWFADVQLTGGPGLLAPAHSGAVTVKLEPGTYVIECYVKTGNEVFHSALGMATQLVVTEARSDAREPRATLAVTVSSTAGIEADAAVRPGAHTVAVHFADQVVYDHFLGHDLHLVRLEDGTDEAALGAWMDWTRTGGLAEPAPATFLGGIQDMPAGAIGYMDVRLEPGRYAWISEVPDPAGRRMLKVFRVPSIGGAGR